MKKTVMWNVYEEEIAYMKAQIEEMTPQICEIRKSQKHLIYSDRQKEKYYISLQNELAFSVESLNYVLQVEKQINTLRQDASIFSAIETVIDKFVSQNIDSLSFPMSIMQRDKPNIVTFEEVVCIKAEISPSGMSGIIDRHSTSMTKETEYRNVSIGHSSTSLYAGRMYLLEKVSLLIKLLQELTHEDNRSLWLICHQLILDSVVKQAAESWVFKYPQFRNAGTKEIALNSYVRLGYGSMSKDFFSFVCWLYYDLDISENFFNFLTDLQENIPKIQKREEYLEFKKEMLPQEDSNLNASKSITIKDIDKYSGIEFEHFIGTLLEADGYRVEYTLASNDKGIDVIARRQGISVGVQCKCYSASVGISAIQEAFAGKNFYSLDKALVITNNYFTAAAIDLAKSAGVILWNRDILIAKISLL